MSAAVVALGASAAAAAPAAPHPNVLIVLADDAGWGDFSFAGNASVATPAVDSLARDGAVLKQFCVQPVCSPTRAELLTGRYHPRSGVRGVSLGQERMAADEWTLANVFHDAGYATGCFGKWHNGTQWPYHPRGHDESFSKDFKPLALGAITLEKGPTTLVLRATTTPGGSVADVRRLVLRPAHLTGS